jgi:hypothetical protein
MDVVDHEMEIKFVMGKMMVEATYGDIVPIMDGVALDVYITMEMYNLIFLQNVVETQIQDLLQDQLLEILLQDLLVDLILLLDLHLDLLQLLDQQQTHQNAIKIGPQMGVVDHDMAIKFVMDKMMVEEIYGHIVPIMDGVVLDIYITRGI